MISCLCFFFFQMISSQESEEDSSSAATPMAPPPDQFSGVSIRVSNGNHLHNYDDID